MFKEADFTLCQASFQAVLPTEDDVSTVNDTCQKISSSLVQQNTKNWREFRRGLLQGTSSGGLRPLNSRFCRWGPNRIPPHNHPIGAQVLSTLVLTRCLWYLLLNRMDEYKCNYSVPSILFLSYLIHNGISSGGGEWNNHYHYLIEWAAFGSLFPEQTSWFVAMHGDWFFVQPQSVIIWPRL